MNSFYLTDRRSRTPNIKLKRVILNKLIKLKYIYLHFPSIFIYYQLRIYNNNIIEFGIHMIWIIDKKICWSSFFVQASKSFTIVLTTVLGFQTRVLVSTLQITSSLCGSVTLLQLANQRVFGTDDDVASRYTCSSQDYSRVLSDTWHSGGGRGRVSCTLASGKLRGKVARNFRLNGHWPLKPLKVPGSSLKLARTGMLRRPRNIPEQRAVEILAEGRWRVLEFPWKPSFYELRDIFTSSLIFPDTQ